MNKALALEVARELKLPPEKVYAVCKSFHDGLRTYIKNPTQCKGGILIHKFVSLNFKEYRLTKTLAENRIGDPIQKQKIVENLNIYRRKNNDKTKVYNGEKPKE